MGYAARTLVAAAIVLAASHATIPAPRLSASALIMGGTNQVLSIPPQTPAFIRDFVAGVNTDLIEPSGLCTGGSAGCDLVAVYTPEQLRYITGFTDLTLDESVAVGRANLDACLRGVACMATSSPFTDTTMQTVGGNTFVVQGVSQSSIISTYEKSHLIAHPVEGATISFILVSNPDRPNGGFAERFVGGYIPLLGITFNGATPTNSPQPNPLLTIDVAHQYDGWADFPTNPGNLLADLNALLGAVYLHDKPLTVGGSSQLQGYYQDTTYYLKPSPVLPLLIPLAAVPVVGPTMAAALDPPLRVLVEAGYDRTINPGQPTPAQWGYTPNLVKTAADLVRSVPTGWDDAIAVATDDPANRPFHTEPQGVYGVGGPPVYAGAIDPYAPVPPAAQPVAAQSDPMPSVATDDIMSSTPTLRAAHRSAPAPSRPHPAAVTAGRDHAPSPSSSKIATARVHPADAA
jgi:hypothetical protein